MMQKQHRIVLSACQATLQTGGVTLVAITGLAGFALTPQKALATVPLTCYVIGSALTTIPASMLMKSSGRRAGFQAGTGVGVLGAAWCALAIYLSNFWLLCLGMTVMCPIL
jgi:MFS family permease